INQHHHRRPVQPHHVMPEPLPVRQLHVHLAQPHPRVVIDHPLAERLPPARPATSRISHTLTLMPPSVKSEPSTRLLQLSPQFQRRTSGAPSLTAPAVNSKDGREQSR